MLVEVGQTVPDFSLPRDGGGSLGPQEFRGRKLVIYFYPKDDTSGCTTEAVAFTSEAEAFAAAETTVVGISKDSVKSHDRFREKHGLTVPLLSDEAGQVIEAFGVWVEKSMYGRKYMGTERATVLVGRDGTVAQVWHKVKVPGHVAEVLKAAQTLD